MTYKIDTVGSKLLLLLSILINFLIYASILRCNFLYLFNISPVRSRFNSELCTSFDVLTKKKFIKIFIINYL